MAQIRTKLKQLRDADVRYISLVDRAATRIPFRVLKRDKETQMIDLTSVFKSDDGAKPFISALVVLDQKDATVGTQIQEAIKAHGFNTDRIQKSEEGEPTLIYVQKDQPKKVHLVRLSDNLLVSVANLKTPAGWVGDMVEENDFFPDLALATAALQAQVQELAVKSETPQAHAEQVITSYAQYLNQMAVLPAACFKLDKAIGEIIQKCSCEDEADEEKTVEKAGEKPGETGAKNPAADAIRTETAYDQKKRTKSHAPAEMAPKDEEDDQKPPPPDNGSMKSDVLAAIKDLGTKIEAVATEQANQKKVLDEVVSKADTLTSTLSSTVTAPPVDADRPSSRDVRMRVEKKDDDPRTGNFDTAFLRRRR